MAPLSSPTRKAAAWNVSAVAPNASFDGSMDSVASASSTGSSVPVMQNGITNLQEIRNELLRLVTNSAQSKAAYRAKLGKLSRDVAEANQAVQSLEQQLVAAREKQALAQKTMDATKLRREKESGRINVRKLHLQVLTRFLDEPSLMAELETVLTKQEDPRKYDRLSCDELAVIRQRLEEIFDLLNVAATFEANKNHEIHAKGASMKHEALKTYISYCQYNQV